jgi:hypothetical protein
VSSIGRLSALVVDRPGLSAMAAGVELVMFWGLGTVLASRYGAVGMAVAALAGTIGYATVIAWSVHPTLPYSPRPAMTAAALALPWVPLALLRGGWQVNLVLLTVAVAGYTALLLWRRVVTLDEIGALRRVMQPSRSLPSMPS